MPLNIIDDVKGSFDGLFSGEMNAEQTCNAVAASINKDFDGNVICSFIGGTEAKMQGFLGDLNLDDFSDLIDSVREELP